TSAVRVSGATAISYELKAENNWQPDLEALENSEVGVVNMMWINYPHMPTGTPATMELFERLVAFGKKHNIMICHVKPYSFILNDECFSLMAVPDAKEVAIELNSLSKSSNMAGWRIGMLIANEDRINEILRFKSNMDSGMFLPLQLAAAAALRLDSSWYSELNALYAKRREKVFHIMDILECNYDRSQVGLFVWAKVPNGYTDGYALSDDILHHAHVFITPGGIFGSAGEQYIRISLCAKEDVFDQAIER